MIEISYDVTNTLRLVRMGDSLLDSGIYFVQERNGVQWAVIARIDGPMARADAHKLLHQYSRQNQAARRAGTRTAAKALTSGRSIVP